MTDEERIRRVVAGDPSAFGPLVEANQGLVYGYLRRRGLDSDEAHDLMQETFLRAMNSLATLREPAAFKGWLMRIAHNELLKHVRGRKESAADLSSEESQALLARGSEALESMDPSEFAGKHLDAQRLLGGLDRLPAIYKESLLLRYQAGLAIKDVAQTLGITLENAKFRIHHGLKLLRAILVTA